MKARSPFDDEQIRRELLALINEIPGVAFGDDVISKRPGIPLSVLAVDPAALAQLERALEWVEQTAQLSSTDS